MIGHLDLHLPCLFRQAVSHRGSGFSLSSLVRNFCVVRRRHMVRTVTQNSMTECICRLHHRAKGSKIKALPNVMQWSPGDSEHQQADMFFN